MYFLHDVLWIARNGGHIRRSHCISLEALTTCAWAVVISPSYQLEIEDAIGVNAQRRCAEDFKEGVEAFLQHRRPDWPSAKAKA